MVLNEILIGLFDFMIYFISVSDNHFLPKFIDKIQRHFAYKAANTEIVEDYFGTENEEDEIMAKEREPKLPILSYEEFKREEPKDIDEISNSLVIERNKHI